MGMFDSYLSDLQKEVSRVTDGLGKMQSGAQKLVKAIDEVEDKVTNLPTEEQIKKTLKRKLKTTPQSASSRKANQKKIKT